jgi:cytosine/adenosine deaminase-related metal-dependent hydrolase
MHGNKNGISPHAPYTVSPALLKDLVSLAREHNVPMAMHLAESREELELLRDGTGSFQKLLEERSMWDADAISRASRPLDYLHTLAESPRALIVHGNYLDEEELSYLAAQRERMSLVYCPRTHDYFFHSSYPLGQALALGVRVALGTDSRASNPDLCLFDEMRHTARAHPTVDPQHVLRMGTLDGAEALGYQGQIGSITPGKVNELIAIPLPDASLDDPSEILASIFAAESVPSLVNLSGNSLNS